VKVLVISMLILLAAFFSFTPAFGQPPEDKSPQLKEAEPQKTADANTAADTNAVADPNAVVRAEIEKFKGLGEALEQINAEGSNEISKWMNVREEKLNLVLAVQEQIAEEFKLLRELAVKEGAAETTAAIDGILLDRKERFNDVIEKLEKETERYRRFAEREERRKELQERRSELNKERASRTKKESQ
jgi:hypothetical protein